MSETTVKKPRWRKWLRRIVLALVLLVAVVLVVRIVAGIVLQREYNAKLAELRKAGEPLKLDELATPEIPAGENAAVYYDAAFALLEYLREMGSRKADKVIYDKGPWTPERLVEAHKLLDPMGEALALLRKGGGLPKCRYAGYYADTDPMRMRRYAKIQAAGRLLRFASQVSLEEGKPDAAVADCVQIIRLARSLDSDPIVLSVLVSIALDGIALKQLATVMDRSDPSSDALREAMTALGDPDDRTRFIRALRGDRCAGLEQYSVMLGDSTAPPNRPDLHTIGWLARPIFLADAIRYLDGMGRLIELEGTPRWKARSDWYRLYAEFIQKDEGGQEPSWPLPLARWVLTALLTGVQVFEEVVARKEDAQLAIALRLFRIKNGHYPAALSELVPEFLNKLPIDPFSGKDFIYRVEGNGFIVYSVGFTGVDHGGVEDPKDRQAGDIVWKCSR
jgi:hypothetical protein